jgi:hypothetical protein
MSAGFFQVKNGLSLYPQVQYGSSDPTPGQDGDIYYNTVLNAFRVFQNGAWQNMISGGGTGGAGYIAEEVSLVNGTTTFAVGFLSPMPDTSYVVFAMMENLIDANPQFQQLEVTGKTINGFNVSWNAPLNSNNYIMSYVVPSKMMTTGETSIASAATSNTLTFPMPQPSATYGVIAQLQNTVDANPQFQSVVVTNQTSTGDVMYWNAPTGSANYVEAYMLAGTAQVAVGSGATSATIALPVDYGTTAYGVVVTTSNTVDANPQYQPLVVTAKTTNSVTVSWNSPTLTTNNVLTAYVISVTA